MFSTLSFLKSDTRGVSETPSDRMMQLFLLLSGDEEETFGFWKPPGIQYAMCSDVAIEKNIQDHKVFSYEMNLTETSESNC